MSLNETTPVGQVLGRVKATDEDVGKHAFTTYTIVGTHGCLKLTLFMNLNIFLA